MFITDHSSSDAEKIATAGKTCLIAQHRTKQKEHKRQSHLDEAELMKRFRESQQQPQELHQEQYY
jgi:hypothetical protein